VCDETGGRFHRSRRACDRFHAAGPEFPARILSKQNQRRSSSFQMKRSWQIQSLAAFIVLKRVARLPARRQPRTASEKGLQKIGIVGMRPALSEGEDANRSEHEG
jgi:hypothetical protein